MDDFSGFFLSFVVSAALGFAIGLFVCQEIGKVTLPEAERAIQTCANSGGVIALRLANKGQFRAVCANGTQVQGEVR